MTDERAIEAGQATQPAQTDLQQTDTVGYFEPSRLADLSKHGRLFLVAEGVGGAASGQIAGQYAIRKILHIFYTTETADPEARLLEIIQQANRDIYERNGEHPERRGMATTLIAALIRNNKLFIANVGDNRVYVAWDQDIERLTAQPTSSEASAPDEATDVKATAEQEQQASPSEPPAKTKSPAKSPTKPAKPVSLQPYPEQALGLEQQVKIETFSRRLFAGDVVILCSGSLSGYVSEDEIARAVARHSPEQAIARILALAGQRGNKDQIGVSVTRVLSSPATDRSLKSMPLPTEPTWSDWETRPKPGETTPLKVPASPAAKPAAKPQPPPSPSEIEDEPSLWNWKIYGPVIVALILFCTLPWLIWRYVIPDELIAAVPFFSDLAEVEATAEVNLPDLDDLDEASTPPAEAGAGQAELTPTAEVAEETESMAAAESTSPLSTPEAAFVSPVNTPSGSSAQDQLEAEPTPNVQLVATTPTPTPAPTIDLPADCENRGRFVDDLTVEDGTQFAPGEEFEKVWLIQNAGDCPWGPGYTVRFLEGDFLGVSREVPLTEVTTPEADGEISVTMTAPVSAGTYRGDWQLFDLNGEPFGPKMYVEIEVTSPAASDLAESEVTTLYDFVENANDATWTTGDTSYTLLESEIDGTMELPAAQGLVARGQAQLRGNVDSEGDVLLTYPHRELGFIEGVYQVDTPLQPTDSLAATVGFLKLSILSDDGVTFEVVFTPDDDLEEQVILSRTVLYQDSPVTELQPLANIEPGQTGNFTLRVVGGDSLNQDWAVWIDLRLIRP